MPEQIGTDNDTTLTSEEFQTFVKQNGILHTTSAPGHPATNGLVERYVQTFKTGMKKLASTTMNIDDRLSLFLLQYRTTPNYTTGQCPADLFLHRHVCTRLVVRQTGPVTYEVRERESDTVHRRHGDQLRARATAASDTVVTDSKVEQLDSKDCAVTRAPGA